MKTKPVSVTLIPWLRANLGKGCLGVLTSTDYHALLASVQIVDLYAYATDPALIQAWGTVVRKMQPSARHLAFHAVAHVRNWDDRIEMWVEAQLGDLPRSVCAYEPQGTIRKVAA